MAIKRKSPEPPVEPVPTRLQEREEFTQEDTDSRQAAEDRILNFGKTTPIPDEPAATPVGGKKDDHWPCSK